MTVAEHGESAEPALTQRRLAEAGRLLASSLDLGQVLDRLARITLEVMRADLVSIWLAEEDEPLLRLGAQDGLLRAEPAVPLRPERDKGLAGVILATAQSLPVEDVEGEPRLRNRAWFGAEGVRSFLGIPLVLDGAAVGVIACMTRTRRAWSTRDLESGEALATAAAVTIRNARLHGETQDRLRQTETLLAVGRAITSTLDFSEAMRRVARETCRALGAGTVAAYVLDGEPACLLPVAGYHVPPQFLEQFVRFPVRIRGNRAVEEGFRTRQPGWCSDAQMEGWTDPELIQWAPLRSVVFCPLFLKDEPIGGLFVVWWTTRAALTVRELSLLEGIAWQTALALSNARLFEARVRDAQQLAERLQQTATLLAVAQAVGSTLELGEVLRRTTREVVLALGADTGSAWCLSPRRDFLVAMAGYRVPKDITLAPESVPVVAHHAMVEQILRMEDLVYSSDSRDDPRFDYPVLRTLPHRSALVVPMRSRGEVLGILVIVWLQASHQFTDEELRLVEGIVRQAGIAIENARLLEGERQREEQQERLLALTRELAAETDPQRLYALTADQARQIMRVDAALLFLVEGDALVAGTVAGAEEGLADDRSLPDAVLRDGRPVACADLAADPAWRETPTGQRFGYRAALAVPLTVKEHTLGVLVLLDRRPRLRPFPPGDVEFAVGLATQAGLAIVNARLFEARGRDAQQLHALNEVSHRLTAIREPREVFATIVTFAAELLDAELVRLWLLDPAMNEMILAAAGGADAEAARRVAVTRLTPGSGIIGGVFRTGQPEFLADVSKDPRWANHNLGARLGLQGFAAVPLVLKDDVIGVLVVLTRRRGDFTPGQRSLIEAFASEAALAIDNARTFETIERSLREARALLGVADSFSHDRELPEILRRVCREATRALGADSAIFFMVNEQSDATPLAGYHVPKSLQALAGPLVAADIPSVMHEAWAAQRALFVPDVSNDPRLSKGLFKGASVRSMLVSPICSKDRLFGDLVLIWFDAVQEVSDSDLALMAAISAQAGLVLENSQLLEATQSQAAALREKNAELDSFVYTVSHDLKAPLVSITGMSNLVLDEHAAGLDDEGRHYLHRVVANTRNMERLIGDLLALSRIGREARDPEEVPLTAVVGDILDELAEPLRARGIEVVIGELPSVRAVRIQMEQVVKNLMTNAVKYMGDAPSPTIEIGSKDRGSELEVWIRDTGIGIDPAYHERIFEVFQRLKEIEAEGTGVGLPIVKKIVEAAGGRIWLESARGQGSTFHFTWPATTIPRRDSPTLVATIPPLPQPPVAAT